MHAGASVNIMEELLKFWSAHAILEKTHNAFDGSLNLPRYDFPRDAIFYCIGIRWRFFAEIS